MTDINPVAADKDLRYAGLFRRLFAIMYDTFLLIAILFIVAMIALTLNQGQAIESDNSFRPFYMAGMFAICYLYFSWFWINGGQTLGMKTWHIRLVSVDGHRIGWKTTTLRFIAAIISWAFAALGFLWALLDRKKRCWHDLISHSELLDLREQK
jgi:uncharacterized RDD family membrane protein YckC